MELLDDKTLNAWVTSNGGIETPLRATSSRCSPRQPANLFEWSASGRLDSVYGGWSPRTAVRVRI
jgi:hypothetical protein